MCLHARAFRKANPEKAIEAVRRWEAKNPERVRSWARASYHRKKESCIAKVTAYQSKNAERVREWKRKYEHSEAGLFAKRVKEAKRRSAKLMGSIPDPLPSRIVKVVFDNFDNRCVWCGGAADTIDHLYPLYSKPNGHALDNLVPACRTCNSRKSRRDPQKWAEICGANLETIQEKLRNVCRQAAGSL